MTSLIFLLNELDNEDLDWIISKGVKKDIAEGETIIYQGEPINHLFIVLEGQYQVLSDNREIALVKPGEVLGEISFVDPRPPIATVRARTKGCVLCVSKVELNFKLFRNTGFASRFYRGISVCLAERLKRTIKTFTQKPLTPMGK